MSNFLSNKVTMYIIGGIVVLLIIAFVVYQIKKDTSIVINPSPLPNTTDWGTNLDNTQAQIIRTYSTKIHEDLSGFNWAGSDTQLYADLLAENDTILTGVYNDFNSLYANEDNGTLTQWLQDEFANFDNIINRLTGLNLL